jgi:hypothetical protein
VNAGKWLAVEEVQQFEQVEPAKYPLADRLSGEEVAALFVLREHLPKMRNGLPTEVEQPALVA